MSKIYLFGKVMDLELKKSSSGKSYLQFAVYSNRESMQFSVFEFSVNHSTGETFPNPLFSVVSKVSDGSPVMVAVTPRYDDRYNAIKYYLNDMYELTPSQQDVIRSILNRSSDDVSSSGSSFKLKR